VRVVVVTGEKLHHKQLCVGLFNRHEVVGIVHPLGTEGSRLRRLRNRARNYGLIYVALSTATNGPRWLAGWATKPELDREARERFGSIGKSYDDLPESLIHRNIDIRDSGLQLLQRLKPDVVVVLGGPVYPREFIQSAPLVLNFHSGLSPIYNGSATIQFAFANGHPHLCGGTLMSMSPVVDGGAILGHFLPEVASGDTPASLFMKTASGATKLYDDFLTHLASNGSFASVEQTPPFFYYRGLHWTLYQTLLTRRAVATDIAGKHVRNESTVEYWREPDDESAQRLFESTIHRLVLGAER
jgi:Formyl transferase